MSPSPRRSLRGLWKLFEDRAFGVMLKAERRVRALPANVRLQPTALDRQVFRLFVGIMAALVIVFAMPSREWRIRTLLMVGAAMVVMLLVFLVLDAFPQRKR